MNNRFKIVLFSFLILGTLFFLFVGLTKGKSFLIPLTTAIILSMVMNPVAVKIHSWGISRGWAIFLADFLIVLFIAVMIFMLAIQAGKVAENWPQIQKKLQPKIEQVQNFLNTKLSISSLQQSGQQQESGQRQQSGQGDLNKQGEQDAASQQGQQQSGQQPQDGQGGDFIKNSLSGFVSGFFTVVGDMLLILVYVFFFMYYQKKFEDGLVGLASDQHKEKTRSVIHQSTVIAQKYLLGRFILIFILAGLYLAGFAVSGLQYAFFIAFIAALFSLIPYIGNIIGLALALGMSFISGGETGQLVGVVITFSIAQFVESYILEPYVVGDKVDLNPVVTIVVVVLGGIVWGVMGMILAIPVIGILKVVFDNVDSLKPFGYVLDEKDIKTEGEDGWANKIKGWFSRK